MKFLFILFSLLLLSSCSKNKQQSLGLVPPEPQKEDQHDKNPGDNTDPVGKPAGIACYKGSDNSSNTCFQTISLENIETPDEYIYKNPLTTSFPTSQDPLQYISPQNILDIKPIDPNLKLSPYFKVAELMQEKRGRYALFSKVTLHAITQIRTAVGRALRINSGYRSPAYNKNQIGGAKWSRHTYGDAVDISAKAEEREQIKKNCDTHGAGFSLIYKSHVHCDWRASKLDQDFFPPVLRPKSFTRGELPKAPYIGINYSDLQ